MRSLGKFKLIGLLGEGGMASVYLSVQNSGSRAQRLAVVKVVKDSLVGDDQFTEMFAQEADLAMRFDHPNVVRGYEGGQQGGAQFFAMEYLEGQSLLSVTRRLGRTGIPLAVHVGILVEVLKALEYAHHLKHHDGTPLALVHRDVTPGNIFITYDGRVKLVDFGIATSALASIRTDTGVLKGKAAYMAPEQATSSAVGPHTDVFAVGILLWEALAGRPLSRKGDNPNALLFRRIQHGDPPIRDAAPDAPDELLAACERATARSPVHRYPRASEMREDLEAWLNASALRASDIRSSLATCVAGAFATERAALASRVDDAIARARGSVGALSVTVPPSTASTPSAELAAHCPVPRSAPTLNKKARGLWGTAWLLALAFCSFGGLCAGLAVAPSIGAHHVSFPAGRDGAIESPMPLDASVPRPLPNLPSAWVAANELPATVSVSPSATARTPSPRWRYLPAVRPSRKPRPAASAIPSARAQPPPRPIDTEDPYP